MKRIVLMSCAVALAALAGCGKKTETASTAPDAGGAAGPAVATAPSLTAPPPRKPGLWVQTIATGGRTQESSICFDAEVDRKMAVWGQQMGKQTCEQTNLTPIAGGWKFSSTCDMGTSGRTVSQGEVKGDFNTHYEVKATSTTTGASMAQMNGAHEMAVTADWKGPCPAGMKPGDMTLPGGMKINMLTMAASMPDR